MGGLKKIILKKHTVIEHEYSLSGGSGDIFIFGAANTEKQNGQMVQTVNHTKCISSQV